MEYRFHHCLSRYDRSVFLILKPISYSLAFIWLGFSSRNYWRWLAFEKKPFQFWREIWIQAIFILLQLYVINEMLKKKFSEKLAQNIWTLKWLTFGVNINCKKKVSIGSGSSAIEWISAQILLWFQACVVYY